MWGTLCATGYWQGELWNRRKDGELYPERLTLNAVLRAALSQVRSWLDAGHEFGSLAVNLSAEQFRHQDIEQTLRAAIADTGLPADRLELEITESQLMDQGERVGSAPAASGRAPRPAPPGCSRN
jgi:hypothetical protein